MDKIRYRAGDETIQYWIWVAAPSMDVIKVSILDRKRGGLI